MPCTVQLYDKQNIETLSWPKTKAGEYARNFLLPLIRDGVSHYIDNAHTEMMAVTVGDSVFPITVTERVQEWNCYVCSPYNQYVSYALECIPHIKANWMKPLFKGLVHVLGKALKVGSIDRVVIVNNWLFSTNLYPKVTHEQVTVLKQYLQKRFPGHAIVFRSVHSYRGRELYRALRHNAFDLIASRQVFFLDAAKEGLFNSRIFKSDLKLLRESDYQILQHHEIPSGSAAKITELYQTIYLGKHSTLNPKWNERFMQLVLEKQLLQLTVLSKGDSIDAVAGYFSCEGVMTAPVLGYDATRSKDDKLYRLTSTLLNVEAKKHGMLFHLSSGASFFKKIRKGEGHVEYMAVCHQHLPLGRRLPWWFLRAISNSIGIPFMRYYDK